MRSFAVSIALTIVTVAAAAVLVAQQPAAPTAPPEMKTYTSAADVQALIGNAKAARLLGAAPYSVNMEYRAAVGPAAVHEREAEIFYIMEGTGTLITGGKLTDEARTNPTNLTGKASREAYRGLYPRGILFSCPKERRTGLVRLAEMASSSTCPFTFRGRSRLSRNWRKWFPLHSNRRCDFRPGGTSAGNRGFSRGNRGSPMAEARDLLIEFADAQQLREQQQEHDPDERHNTQQPECSPHGVPGEVRL
jgi:mannose-6-phosphate isomerase-like protein (cupin superfamily)